MHPKLIEEGYEEPDWILFVKMTPFNLFIHGYFWVVIFFILSGFVLPLRFFKKQQASSIFGGTYRRYLRLMLPLAVAASLYYFVAKSGFAS